MPHRPPPHHCTQPSTRQPMHLPIHPAVRRASHPPTTHPTPRTERGRGLRILDKSQNKPRRGAAKSKVCGIRLYLQHFFCTPSLNAIHPRCVTGPAVWNIGICDFFDFSKKNVKNIRGGQRKMPRNQFSRFSGIFRDPPASN